MNNNLIIFYKDDSKDVYSFPVATEESGALNQFKEMRPDVQPEDIEKYFYIKEDDVAPDVYGNFFELSEDKKLKMNIRLYTTAETVKEIRSKRDALLNKLDLPFMRALEDDNDDLKKHIIKLKGFLRDLPNNLRIEDIKNDEDLASYNPFGNIFDVTVINGGSGYKSPPKVTIDPPKCKSFGFQARAVALIKDGKISRIEVVDKGSAYNYIPKITIEAPKEGEVCQAACAMPQNVFLSQEELIENTMKYYS